MPATAPTIATALKAMGYATGQFGKNHFGDLNGSGLPGRRRQVDEHDLNAGLRAH
jgi:arylsulfatase A-like enzyme